MRRVSNIFYICIDLFYEEEGGLPEGDFLVGGVEDADDAGVVAGREVVEGDFEVDGGAAEAVDAGGRGGGDGGGFEGLLVVVVEGDEGD